MDLSRVLVMSLFLSVCLPLLVSANAPDHLVISEVQISGATAKDEFVELFNPTPASVNMQGWKLKKKISSGAESNLVTSFPDLTIAPYSFLLIVHPTGYNGSVARNVDYSSASYSITDNNTVLLYDDTGALVDKVGMGSAIDSETVATVNPDANKSVARKSALLPNGVSGPAEDTDHNLNDFELQDQPNPQNADVALPVLLRHSQAYWSPDGMMLEWQYDPQSVIHWHVWRASREEGPFERITQEPIRRTDSGLYQYVDETATRGTTYFYMLESFDQMGESSRSAIISATPLVIRDSTLATTWGALKRR